MKKILFPVILILLMLLSTFLAGWAILQYLPQRQFANPILLRVLALLAMGLTAGFLSRFFFRKWYLLLRLIIALVSMGLALFLLDRIYPKNYALVFMDRVPWSQPIGIDLLQIGLGYGMSLLSLFVGRRKKPSRSEIKTIRPTATLKVEFPIKKKKKKILVVKSKKKSPQRKVIQKKAIKPLVASQRVRSNGPLGGYILSNLIISKPRRTRQKDVKLLGETEHRCPYCLELVKKNDARGVVICPECKTWHHKDCWEVTGACQVAHRHDL